MDTWTGRAMKSGAVILVVLLWCGLGPVFAGTSGFQEYLIPGQESLLRSNYAYIDNDPVVGNTMHCVISVTASTDGTIINYDHWENGYGTPDESITLNTGGTRIFESGNIPANPRGTDTFYDGGDRITVIGGPAFVSRASWPESPGVVMALAFEILPVQALSSSFEMPVGSDLYQSDRSRPFADFSKVTLLVQSTHDNNLITIYNPDNTVLYTGTLAKGQSITDTALRSVRKGTRVTATWPVQIQFLNGLLVNQTSSQINGFTGLPTALWGRRYAVPATSFPASNQNAASRTDIYLYNPNTTPITITYKDSTSGSFTIAAKELASYALKTGHYLPRSYGADLNGSATFWGFGIGGSGYDSWDWGFILIPKFYCRTSYVIGWAPGDLNKTNNYSAVYVMPFGTNSRIYVDYDQNGTVDQTYTASHPQVVRITDSDYDMTGARIWSPDTLAMNYGELSGSPTSISSPALDLGYTVIPLAEQFVEEVLSIEKGVNIDSVVVGHPAQFTLSVTTHSYLVGGIKVNDFMPQGWDYLAGSALVSFSDGTPSVHTDPAISGTLATGLTLVWDLGYTMNPNTSLYVTFSIVPTSSSAAGMTENCAEVQGSNSGNTFRPDGCDFIDLVPGASIGDRVWNDLDGDGVQDSGEAGLAGITVYLRNSQGALLDSTSTDPSGHYLFTNLMPGAYRIDIKDSTLPYGFATTTGNDPLPVTVTAGQTFLTADFGYRADSRLGDRVWNDLNRNGLQDAGEPGFAGVNVALYTSGGTLVASTLSSSDGLYSFGNLVPGDYYLAFTAPAGYGFSPANQGGDDASDSDADPATGRTSTTSLAAGEGDSGWDAGLFELVAAIQLQKLTNGDDADLPAGPSIPVGETVTWRYVVTNPGDVALTGLSVTDNQAGVTPAYLSGDDGNGRLDPAETWVYQATGTAVAGAYQNIGTVTAQYGGQTVTSSDPSHYFGGQAGIQIKKYTNGEDADAAPGPYIAPGASVTWSYVISNTGNVAIGGIRVSDSEAGITPIYLSGDDGNGLLDPGESWSFQAAGTARAGQYANIGTVNGTDIYNRPVSDSDLAHYFGPLPAIHIEKLVNGEDADVPAGPAIPVGQVAHWSYVVTNAGNVPLAAITVSDDKELIPQAVDTAPADGHNDGDTDLDNLLDLDETWTYTAEAVVAAGPYVNTGTATGRYEGQTVSNSDPCHYFGGFATIDIQKSTNGQDADTPPGPSILAGSAVVWRYLVSNQGNTAIRDVAVSDDRGVTVTPVDEEPADGFNDGDLDRDGQLDPAEVWRYQATGTATTGAYSNTGTVTGVNTLTNESLRDEDRSHYYGAVPGIEVRKYTNGEDANTAPGPTLVPGAAVTWRYVVTNTGNVPLDSIRVTDSDASVAPVYLSGDVDEDGWLDTAEVWIFEAYGQAVTGSYENTGTVAGRFESATVQDDDSSHYFCELPRGSISNRVWVDLNRNGLQESGEPGLANVAIRIYSGSGLLAGSTLSNSDGLYLFDNLVPGPYYLIFTPPDEYGLTPADQGGDDDLDSDADPLSGRTVTLTLAPGENQLIWDVGFYPFVASLTLDKSVNGEGADLPPGPSVPVGSLVTWRYRVTNTGDVPLSQIHVTDSDESVAPAYLSGDDGDGLLEPDEAWIFEASGSAIRGQYQNLGTATGLYEEQTLTDTDPAHYFGGQAAIGIKKATNGEDADTQPGPYIAPGAAVTWSYLITNPGNVAISNLLVTDSEVGVTPAYLGGDDGNGLLDPGESWSYQATGVAQSGQYGNVGTVYGTDIFGQPVTASDASHYFGPAPAIHLEKLTNGLDSDLPIGPAIPVGQHVIWSYIVTNTGNLGLSQIAVTDDREAVVRMVDTTPADGFNDGDLDLDQVLDPDETWTFTAAGVALVGQYSNLGTVTGRFNGQTVTASDPSHYFGGQGAIEIEKSTNGLDADSEPGPGILAGTPVLWLYQVRNTGNTPVRELTVSDNQGATPVMLDAAPADGYNDGDANLNSLLDPGESWSYTASGTAQPGPYTNIGSVTGIDALTGQILSDEDPSHYFGATPAIDIEKFTNGEDADSEPGPVILLGGTVTWRYQVRNTGNVPLDSVTVADSDPALHPVLIFGDLNNDQILDLDETWIYEASGTAVAGQYANTGTAGGRYHGTLFQDSDISHYYAEGRMDFGDAPDPAYPTLLANNGARHILSTLYLGSTIDTESDGAGSGNDSGDDLAGSDDEDGIAFPGLPFIQNSQNEVAVISSGAGYLEAWIDFNRDGDWLDAGEQILTDQPVSAGYQLLFFQVPEIDPFAAPETRAMNARFRLSSQPGLGFAGLALDGEVEDYQVAVYVPVELTSFTAAASHSAVELAWTTQSETENLGFYLFRATEQAGPYERIGSMIAGAGSSTAVHAYRYTDATIEPGHNYWYKLADISLDGAQHMHEAVQVQALPAEYGLEQNYPNPFNPETSIHFTLKEGGSVSLTILNMQGQIVRNLVANRLDAGAHVVRWDARNDAGTPMPSGNYLCILKVNGFSKTIHMTLLK